MKLLLIGILAALCITSVYGRIVCFWDTASSLRTGSGRFDVENLELPLYECTHLIYGYAGITAGDYTVKSLHRNFDNLLETRLKRKHPELKVYMSIGGEADPYESTHKYLKATATPESRRQFIDSILRTLSKYELDGIDLAWQFPKVNERTVLGFYVRVGGSKRNIYEIFHDRDEKLHREGFTTLVHDLHTELRARNKSLTLTVLPLVNITAYYDVKALAPYVDAVHLMAFDQQTPKRNPKKADYPAPIYRLPGRSRERNVDFIVTNWIKKGMPSKKVVLGIPTFGRTWKIESRNATSRAPLRKVRGPGPKGPLTKTRGFYSYTELCLLRKNDRRLTIVDDSFNQYGTYAYLPYDTEKQIPGMWIGFEDAKTARQKARYAVDKDLGGIATFDLSTDDFRGVCFGTKFPILSASSRYFRKQYR